VSRYPLFSFCLVGVIVVIVSRGAAAQAWSPVLPSARAANWAQAGAGAIPSRTSPASNCATLGTSGQASSFVQSVTYQQINSAIASCGSGQVVYLNAGTYKLTSGINLQSKSDITIRGAGANQTILVFSDYDGCQGAFAGICMNNNDGEYSAGIPSGHTANWTGTKGVAGTYTQGSNSLMLDNVTGLSVGMLLFIDQLEDTSDTGNVYVAQISSGAQQTCVSCANPSRSSRGQMQTVLVTSISGSGPYNVGITPGIYMPNWRTSQSPGAWWATYLPITSDGIEDMTLDGSQMTGNHGGGLVVFYNCVYCWTKGLRTIMPKDSHIKMWYGNLFDTVRDSYFYGSQMHGGSSSQSYGYDGYTGSTDLVENNIFQDVSTAMQIEDQQGTVLGYNYVLNSLNLAALNWLIGTASEHAPGNSYTLWEGNQNVEMIQDDIHGPSDFVTYFRNRATGWQAGATYQTVPIMNFAWSRYTNALGNVLGTAGYSTRYASITGDGGTINTCNLSIYSFGHGGNCVDNGVGAGPQNDALVATTAIRWGNYDTANSAVLGCTAAGANAFDSSHNSSCTGDERGKTAPAYPGLATPSTTLPSSFYLSGTPAWFGSTPFPAVGPDVAGGNLPNLGGYANGIPAYQAFLATPVDSTYATPYTGVTGSWSNGTATVTVGSIAANMWVSGTITISGMTPSGYNCTHCVLTATTGTTVSYAVATNPGGNGSGATAYWPDIISFNENVYYGQGGGVKPPQNLQSNPH